MGFLDFFKLGCQGRKNRFLMTTHWTTIINTENDWIILIIFLLIFLLQLFLKYSWLYEIYSIFLNRNFLLFDGNFIFFSTKFTYPKLLLSIFCCLGKFIQKHLASCAYDWITKTSTVLLFLNQVIEFYFHNIGINLLLSLKY